MSSAASGGSGSRSGGGSGGGGGGGGGDSRGSGSGAGAGAGADASDGGRRAKRAREDDGGDGAAAPAHPLPAPASASAPAPAPVPARHLPAPGSHSARGLARALLAAVEAPAAAPPGAIEAAVLAHLPTATWVAQWRMRAPGSVAVQVGLSTTLPVPYAVSNFVGTHFPGLFPAVPPGGSHSWTLSRQRLTITKHAGGVFTLVKSYIAAFFQPVAPAARARLAAAAAAVPCILSLEFIDPEPGFALTMHIHERPVTTTNAAEVRARLAVVTHELRAEDDAIVEVTTQAERVVTDHFPSGAVTVIGGGDDDDDDGGGAPRVLPLENLPLLAERLAGLDAATLAQVAVLRGAAETEAAACRVRLADAAELFFAAQT
jgi:hypothetical protein